MTTPTQDLEERILLAVHEPDAVDLELVVHEIAASDDAQAYLVELIGTLSALSPASEPAMRAAMLLEHGMAIVAERAVVEHHEAAASTTRTTGRGRDPNSGS